MKEAEGGKVPFFNGVFGGSDLSKYSGDKAGPNATLRRMLDRLVDRRGLFAGASPDALAFSSANRHC